MIRVTADTLVRRDITVRAMRPRDDAAWDGFVLAHPAHLAFYTTAYRDFLLRACPGSTARYLVAEHGTRLVGVMPAMSSAAGEFGAVLNALSFYGSHGAPLVAPDVDGVASALLDAFDDLAVGLYTAARTVVSNPLDAGVAATVRARGADCTDSRIGQLTFLPTDPGSDTARSALLLSMFSGKRRNQVRKTLQSGITVRVDNSFASLRDAAALHRDNIEAIGGIPKPLAVFDALGATHAAGRQREMWIAELDGVPIAYLLLLHTGSVVEYFTPAVRADARALQPLTLLIYHAMRDALARGARIWNWGGTWTSQHGVYEFKRGWGTSDLRYDYFTRVLNPALYLARPAELLREYPYFFTLPFARLNAA